MEAHGNDPLEEEHALGDGPERAEVADGRRAEGRDVDRIRLDDFLKLSGRVRSGGEAKHRIQAGDVLVNGAAETHRSRRLARGDTVTLDGHTVKVTF